MGYFIELGYAFPQKIGIGKNAKRSGVWQQVHRGPNFGKIRGSQGGKATALRRGGFTVNLIQKTKGSRHPHRYTFNYHMHRRPSALHQRSLKHQWHEGALRVLLVRLLVSCGNRRHFPAPGRRVVKRAPTGSAPVAATLFRAGPTGLAIKDTGPRAFRLIHFG